ncbi:MAG: DNA recombination protein RmuC [Acidobacteriota bacterium]
METLVVIVAVLIAVVLLVLLVQFGRVARQEREVREQLAKVSLELAQSQRDFTALSGLLTGMIDRFYTRLDEFGQQVRGGQEQAGGALLQRLEEARRTLQELLIGSQEGLARQSEGATKLFGELKGQLGQVAQMAARMEALGREIDELQGILKAPKLRGTLGEAQLEEFLRQVLPPAFWETQFRFADGQIVDAVIRLRDHLVPIDAKFPLESFRRLLAAADEPTRKTAHREFERAVKGRIDEIADKYIRPGEGTYEFALMFIPAENIYYEVIIRDDNLGESGSLLEYATSRRVVPVSPNSFYAYLSTIVTGLKGMQVEARAREILVELGRLQREFARFSEAFRLVGRHLSSAQGKYEEADKLSGRIGDRLQGITGEALDAGGEAVGTPLLEGDAVPRG